MTTVRPLAAEFIGTFALVFAGTGAIIIDDVAHGVVTHLGVALVFGLVVLAVIQAFGESSGAHINPAVTIAFAAAGRFPKGSVAGYLVAQICGALAASLVLRVLFPTHLNLGATLPSGSEMQALVLEFLLSFFLMLVILSVSSGARERGLMAGVAIGAVVTLEALFAGPISGASMNPARSLAPALVSGSLGHVWIYLVAPTLGMLLAVPVCCLVQAPGCCARTAEGESR